MTKARICKTAFLMEHPAAFLALLVAEIRKAQRKFGSALAVRLNTFSDLRWERIVPWLFVMFADVQFYDYSKAWGRVGKLPVNYHLTYSVSELTSDTGAAQRVAMGENIAVCFPPDAPRRCRQLGTGSRCSMATLTTRATWIRLVS